MFHVKSKYTNPDKFIAKLKRRAEHRLERINLLYKDLADMRGEAVVVWNDGIFDTQTVTNRYLGDFKLGDKIAIIGEITAATEEFKKDGSKRSEVTFKRLRTRKVKGSL